MGRLFAGLAGIGCITSLLGGLAILDAENIHDDGLRRVARLRLDDLRHDKVAFGDDPLEIHLLFWPMGAAVLLGDSSTVRRIRSMVGATSAPLHLALGDLGSDIEGNAHAETWKAGLHGCL